MKTETIQDEKGLSGGYLAVFATVVIWSTPSLFQFYLIRYYEPWSQNFYRYLVAFFAVLPFVLVRFRAKGGRLDRAAFIACLIPSLPNVIHQITQTVALYHMGPGVYAIFGRSAVIFTALLALIFFPEERWIIRQWQFQLGTVLGLLGAVGVVCFQEGWQLGALPLRGFAIALTASLCWALYSVLVKRPSARLGPIRSFGVISFITSILLLALTCLFGKIATPLHVGAEVNIILIVSAVSCISLAHVLYYVAIRKVGVALSQTLQLICPAGALGLSALFFGEHLTAAQLWSAALLLFGAFLAMRVKPAEEPAAMEEV
ncbi:MAG TPA: DMT family transporter [Chthoniobacterales bacterium]|nr:DMT family transporter [Chthoniobacterales bacterium]